MYNKPEVKSKAFHRIRAHVFSRIQRKLYKITAKLRQDPLLTLGVDALMKQFSPWFRKEWKKEQRLGGLKMEGRKDRTKLVAKAKLEKKLWGEPWRCPRCRLLNMAMAPRCRHCLLERKDIKV